VSPELSRLAPCSVCGQHRLEMAMCQCGHPVLVHHLTDSKKRTWCTAADGDVKCPCKGPR
jgi:hypothetical protein